MTPSHHQQIHAALAGLSYGDGHSYAALWHRIPLQPARKRLFSHKAATWVHEQDHTTQTHPHRHSAPEGIWEPTGPTDSTEWVYVTLLHALGQPLPGSPDAEVWPELARLRAEDPQQVRGRSGTVYALNNIQRSLAAPASGNDNAHYFDDHSIVRGAALGLLHPGNPEAAAEAAHRFLSITHSEDGLWCGQVAAALVAAGLGGATFEAARDKATEWLPLPTWSSATLGEMLDEAALSTGPADLADRLESKHVDDIYTFNVCAPETLGLLLAHLTMADTAEVFLAGIQAHPRGNSGIMPAAGLLASIFYGAAWLPAKLQDNLPALAGSSITVLRDAQLDDLTQLIATQAANSTAA